MTARGEAGLETGSFVFVDEVMFCAFINNFIGVAQRLRELGGFFALDELIYFFERGLERRFARLVAHSVPLGLP